MINESKNKMITSEEVKNKEVEEEYFFSGGGEYIPVTVKARSRMEAEQIWEKVRQEVIDY